MNFSLFWPIAALLGLQVPPPPVPVSVRETSAKMTRALKAKDRAAYAELLSDHVRVWHDGKLVASSKSEWLGEFAEELVAPGVLFEQIAASGGASSFIQVTRYNSQASWPGTRQECCAYFDTTKYELRDGKVIAIRRLRTGDMELTAEH